MEETKNNIKAENESAVKTENVPAVKAENALAVKRNYKDSVFRMLFSDKASLLSLFNALTGSHYENPDELEIVTLDNVISAKNKLDSLFFARLFVPDRHK